MEAVLEPLAKQHEPIVWHANWKVEKYLGDLPTEQDREGHSPYDVIKGEGNLLLNEGINEVFKLLCNSGSPTAFSQGTARIGVGDSNAGENATQTALQGGETAYVTCSTVTAGTSQKVTFVATFDGSTGNFAGGWQEWSVDNGASAAINLNRKVVNLGVKTSGTTWVFTVEVSLS
ncbi:MAG: hypothetical protein JSV90_05025 [Methanobacteriota archaeon]|nr:MAG: hypothetical protein JSV90_05025 [Euryarchaeota archaeon]